MAITPRNSGIVYVNSAASVVVPLPTGSLAGDYCVVLVAHAFGINAPTGWDIVDSSGGTNTNGAVFQRNLTSADITTGSVTITFTGTFSGVVAIMSFVGSLAGAFVTSASRNTTGAATRTVTTANGPLTGNYALYFGSARASGAVTSSAGTPLQTSTNAVYSGVLTGSLLAANGPLSSTFSFATVGADYDVIVVIQETATMQLSKAGMVAVLRTPLKTIVAKAGMVAVLRPKVLHDSNRRRQGMRPIF